MPTTKPAVPDADPANYSVLANVATMQKYMLFIDADQDAKAPKVVPVRNGDYQLNVIRGRWWIVPEAIVTVLKDAAGDQVDERGRVVGKFHSYPFRAQKYNGELPLKSEVDENGEAAKPIEPLYA